MGLRNNHFQQRGELQHRYHWTVMPPSFFEMIVQQDHNADTYANGSRELYPPLWHVDMVLLPMRADEQNWYLLQIDLKSMKINAFFPHDCTESKCGESFCLHRKIHYIFLEFEAPFLWFLRHIGYWEKAGRYEIDEISVCGDVVWPNNTGHIGRNSGAIICMLLRILVLNMPMEWKDGNVHDACMRYRRFMADEIYSGRYIPKAAMP